MGSKKDLLDLEKATSSEDIISIVNNARAVSTGKEVEKALTDFVIRKLEKLSENDEFMDLIKMHIRQRLPEATFAELLQLAQEMQSNNIKETSSMMSLFKNETSGKNLLDNLKDNSVAGAAQQLYDSTDSKDILQAVSYLSQVLGRLGNAPSPTTYVESN